MNTIAPARLNRHKVPSTNYPVKVLQFGEGNFLRAFADWMIDILNEATPFRGMVQIVQPLPKGMGEVINEQEGLYHVVLHGIEDGNLVRNTRLITSVKGVINPYDDFTQFLRLGQNPELKFIISNTTEAGITFSDEDKDPNQISKTYPGKLTSLLYHRFKAFGGTNTSGLIFLPCELIDRNGDKLREAILAYASLWQLPAQFTDWINEQNVFCNTLVDRIVPGFPADIINDICQETGYDDKVVVKAEPFHLWVIEGPAFIKDHFPADAAGLQVKFVGNLQPYRTRKVRILNGAHTAMVPVAYLRGLRTVQETVEDPEMGRFVNDIVFNEIIPTLDLPEEELKSFAASVLERFKNPYIRHELSSIALNSISKFKVRVLPSLLEYQKRRESIPPLLALSLAALIRFYKGEYRGTSLPVNDSADILEFFRKVWANPSTDVVVEQVLSNESLWEVNLLSVPGLRDAVAKELARLDK